MVDNSMKSEDVVAAIIKKDNLYFIAQRSRDKYMGLKWEFPGGKVEANETLQEALIREIYEELNININVYEKIAEEKYKDSEINIVLHYFLCSIKDGVLVLMNMRQWNGLIKQILINMTLLWVMEILHH